MNKKANTKVFGFFFILVILSAIMLFLGVGMHFITQELALEPVRDIGINILNSSGNVSNATVTRLNNVVLERENQVGVYDLLFLVFMISIFIESLIGAIKTKRMGWFSFFGFITVGNLIFGLIVYFAIQIRGWILNEIFYNVITESFTSTWFDYFVNNTWWLLFVWYLLIIVLSFIDVSTILSKITGREPNNAFSQEGRFEE